MLRRPAKGSRLLARILAGAGVAVIAASLSAGPALANTGNQGHYTEDKLYPGQYLANGSYKFIMQTDGNLVLYGASNHVCWASNTQGLDGTYLDYNDHSVTPPDATLKNSSYGQLGHWWGSYEWLHKNGNLSLNSKGEVWIAWKKWVHC